MPSPRLALLLAAALVPLQANGAPRMVKGVPAALLAEAAKSTPLRSIDYDEDHCDDRTVDQWLRALTGPNARSITWQGGPCQIVGMGIDSGSDWCAQATVTLAHPKARDDKAVIEIFFDKPVHGRPGKAYAFRGMMLTPDGQDMTRFRKDFEAEWLSRFEAPEGAVIDCPADP